VAAPPKKTGLPEFLHATVEPATKLLPLIVSVNPGPPAVTFGGEIDAMEAITAGGVVGRGELVIAVPPHADNPANDAGNKAHTKYRVFTSNLLSCKQYFIRLVADTSHQSRFTELLQGH
jgi:hypothetical protein